MDNEMKEAIWILAGCLFLAAGVYTWIRIIHWDKRIRRVINKIDTIVSYVEDQETLNRL